MSRGIPSGPRLPKPKTWDLEQQPDGTYSVYRAHRGPVFTDMTLDEAVRRTRAHRLFQLTIDTILVHADGGVRVVRQPRVS